MSDQSNSSQPIVSLPSGGGALHGIGEKFSPDLHTGTGNFTVPLALPPGRNGFQPQLSLIYSTGNGNGPFGLGWSLSVPGIARHTAKGVPRYRDASPKLSERDSFILSGAEDLVQVSGEYPGHARFRPRTEGLFALIERQLDRQNDFWQVHGRDGLVSTYGTPRPDLAPPDWQDPSAIADPADKSKVFAWKLIKTEDPFGNQIVYDYERDSRQDGPHHWDQLYPKQIRYADYTQDAVTKFLVSVTFEYEDKDRTDSFSEYRAGFEIRTRKRCARILVETHAAADRKVRRYEFKYAEDGHNGASRLTRVDIVGFDDAGNEARELPPLEFGYSSFRPEDPRQRDFYPIQGSDLPAFSLANPDFELVDLFGNGLPDVLQMNGVVRYWRNLGDGTFDLPRPMREAPPVAFAETGVQLIDADGDGRTDLLVTQNGLSGYYSLRFGGLWDRRSFHKYARAPSFNLEDPEVRLVDLTGAGVADAIRSGTRLECFFNDPHKGWLPDRDHTRFVERKSLEVFPNVNFSDPRVKLADISGDGLQDIVLVYDGKVQYWPNLGYGNWSTRIHMRNSPRFPYGYDPRRVLIGDVDGDGLADIVYVGDRKVCLWVNQSGNAWSDPIEIDGTPPVSDMDAVRLADLLGTGISGVLFTRDAAANRREHYFFLDLTGGTKPYLLNVMDNHLGAETRVEYAPSTRFYLADQKKPSTRWITTLPFPVQVVARVEVIDQISQGKLTTEYRYHHGYWDGAEREFRGFGMVEQLDTETFEEYNRSGLHGEGIFFQQTEDRQRFSAPTLTKTWFHQGPVGDEFGGWAEPAYDDEYWQGDLPLLERPSDVRQFLAGLPRRVKRDAIRALRGSILRTELYALDAVPQERRERPYTITETMYGVCEVVENNGDSQLSCQLLPDDAADRQGYEFPQRVFFPHVLAQRTTQWERGEDPLTQFAFTGDYDNFGQPRQQTAVAMPRRAKKRRTDTGAVVGDIQPDETKVLTTHTFIAFATPPSGKYMHHRVAQTKSYELLNPPGAPDLPDDDLRAVLTKQLAQAQQVRDTLAASPADETRVFSHVVSHYDGEAFEGLPVGQLGDYGALVRAETLVLTEEILRDAYADPSGARRPGYLEGTATASDAPPGFGSRTGYRKVNASAEGYLAGWYVDTQRQQFDFQASAANPRGLVAALRDALGNETRIEQYDQQLLPTRIKDAAGMEITADYNYRVLQPARVTDPDSTSTHMVYNSVGLPLKQFVRGTDALGNETLGGSEAKPEISFVYDFLHFERENKPIFVHTQRRIHHESDNLSDDTIDTREYSDGFGRLVQTRAHAEEWAFGATSDDAGLLPQPGADPGPAVARRAVERVVVSGWQLYDNKGRGIEKYEPFFSQKFDFEPEADARRGTHATMFYDPRGNAIRMLNPDGSQQRVILGRPQNSTDLRIDAHALASSDVPISFEPTPWETYTYDANDLAPISFHPTEKLPDGTPRPLTDRAPDTHHFTPSSIVVDALGRMLCQVQRNGGDPANDWFVTRTEYDLRGNALQIVDAHGRDAFKHVYDLLNRRLRVDSLDAGLRTSVLDAQGSLIEYRDTKGSLARRIYDVLNRAKELWARNDSSADFTLRERVHYGDEGNRDEARRKHTLGRPVKHYDEAGLLESPEYDFKGNLLEKSRRTIKDDALANDWLAHWDAPNPEDALEAAAYQSSSRYDALSRPSEVTYPQDADGGRKKLVPSYNRAGALQALALDDADYVGHIAYNAKGQRVFILYRNGVMTRHAYDSETFRLARLHTDRVTQPGLITRFVDGISGGPDTMTFESSGNPLQAFAYTYDLAGNITAIDERVTDCGITNTIEGRNRLLREFDYDPLYRLAAASGRACKDIGGPRGLDDDPRCGFYAGGASTATQNNAPDLTEGYAERYSYDPAGNMLDLSYQAASGKWKRVFGMGDLPNDQWQRSPNNRLTSLGNGGATQSYQFDGNGNLKQQNTERHHTWDHANRMVGYRVQPNPTSPASVEARYLYGADGMRVKKWVLKNGNASNDESTVYVDGVFEHHSWTERGTPKENNHLHIMYNRSRVAILRVGDKYPDDGGEKVQYHLADHLGCSTVVVGGDDSAASTFINREEYFPYGETSFGSFARKRYRYSGKEQDEESGLYYFGARHYAAGLCRWASTDPLGFVSGLNLYGFASNTPLSHQDPDGMQDAPVDQVQPAPPRSRMGISTIGSQSYYDNLNGLTNVAIPDEPQHEEDANGKPTRHTSTIESRLLVARKIDRQGEKFMAAGKAAAKVETLQIDKEQGMTQKEYKRALREAKPRLKEAIEELNDANKAIKGSGVLKTKAVNALALKPVGSDVLSVKKAISGGQQKVLTQIGNRGTLLTGAGALLRVLGTGLQVVNVATMAMQDSPAVTGQPVSTYLDPHLADQVSSESRYFLELIKYAVGMREAAPELPPHMRAEFD
jgi:RHS repeat-associated protein